MTISHARRLKMKRTNKILSDADCQKLLKSIIQIIIDEYRYPLNQNTKTGSRAGSAGYKIIQFLFQEEIISPGQPGQERLKV